MSKTDKAKTAEEDIEDIEEEHGGSKDTIGFKFKHAPKKQDTGVDEAIARLAAALSGQLYGVKTKRDFDLSQPNLDVKTVVFDDHGKLKVVSPYFGGAVTGSTMVIGWRGTTDDIMNMLTDINATPATSSRWSHISPDLEVHGGFHPIAENDLCRWESRIIELMEKHGITELVTTGHSLGGAIATVAHLAIHGELRKERSMWKDYADKLKSQGKKFTVRCIGFSAPYSIFNMAEADNAVVNNFLKEIESTSCNVVYSTDPVPRAPGHLEFIDKLAKELIPEIKDDISKEYGILGRVGTRFFLDLSEGYEAVKESQSELLEAMLHARHVAKIIYYENDVAEPVVAKDYGDGVKGNPEGIKNFRDIQWKKTPDVIGNVLHNHSMTVRGPGLGYNIPEDLVVAKLYSMHNRSLMEDEPDVAKVEVDGWEDCRKKAKEHFVYAFMGGYVDWADEPKDKLPHERKGILHVKANVAKGSDEAEWVKSRGYFGYGEVEHSALWRTPALADKVELAKKVKEAKTN